MNQLKIVFILVVCGLYSVAANEECTEGDYHVVEGDCSMFYRCVNGQRVNFACPDDLKFDITLNTCVAASQIDCVAIPRPTTEAAPTTPKIPSQPTADCPKGDGYFVVEKDCSRYYVCSDGVRHYSSCDNGLHFDTVSKTCSYPTSAKCTNE